MRKLLLITLISLFLLTACSSAGRVNLSIEDALNSNLAHEKLDSGIKMSFGKSEINGRN
jgi:uncharacterized protein YcfL